MGYIKLNENVFLHKQELNRLVKFLDEDGFRLWMKNNAISFGLFNLAVDGNFVNGQVTPDAGNTFQIAELLGIDNDLNFIYKQAQSSLQLNGGVVDDNWYWIKYSHQHSPLEQGTVSIDTSGNLTGVSTAFLEVLRGQPNFASKIKFYNQDGSAATNDQEYDVVEVVDNTNAVLAGVFSAESDLKYSVVGTFTTGASPTAGEKEIFQYDNALIEIIQESVANTPPALVDGQEFVLARIKNSAQLVIQDKRTAIYQSKDNYYLRHVDRTTSPLLGIEQVRYSQSQGVQTDNIVKIAWGFRTSNYTIDTNLNRVTYNTGAGGKFKSTDDFTNGDFDGWRLYTDDGKYSIIKSSIKSGSQINLDLDVLDVDSYSDDGGDTLKSQTLTVVPDAEAIVLLFTGTIPNAVSERAFPIRTGWAEVLLPAYDDPTCTYTVTYRYRNNNDYGPPYTMPDDGVLGYLNEDSFDADGAIDVGNETYQTYTGGEITLQLAPTSYKKVISSVITGDLFGYFSRDLDNGSPVINLRVGSNFQNQRINPTQITLTTEHYINLRTLDASEGNSFILDIQADIDLDGQTFQIVQDYVNAGDPGTLILDMSFARYTENAAEKNLLIRCIFDGTNWNATPIIDQYGIQKVFADLPAEGVVVSTGWGFGITELAYQIGGELILHLQISKLVTGTGTTEVATLPDKWASYLNLPLIDAGVEALAYDGGSPYLVRVVGNKIYAYDMSGNVPADGTNLSIVHLRYHLASHLPKLP